MGNFVEIRRFELLLPESKSSVLNHYTISQYQADREGFEPSEEFTSAVLETAALNHSATDLYLLYQYYQRPGTDDWVRTNDLQNMSLLL